MSAEPRGALRGGAAPSKTPAAARPEEAPCVAYVHHKLLEGEKGARAAFARAKALGFDAVLLSPLFAPGRSGDVFAPGRHDRADPAFAGDRPLAEVLKGLAAEAAKARLGLFMDVPIRRFDLDHPLVAAHPDAFRRPGEGGDPLDPRAADAFEAATPRLRGDAGREVFLPWLCALLEDLGACGVTGFRLLDLQGADPWFWTEVLKAARRTRAESFFIADTLGMSRAAVGALRGAGFDATTSSLAFWDGRADWFFDELKHLEAVAPPLAVVEAPFGPRRAGGPLGPATLRRALSLAPMAGRGLLAPLDLEHGPEEPLDPCRGDAARFLERLGEPGRFAAEVSEATVRTRAFAAFKGPLLRWSGPAAQAAVLVRLKEAGLASATGAAVGLVNTSLEGAAEVGGEDLAGAPLRLAPDLEDPVLLDPGEGRFGTALPRDVVQIDPPLSAREAGLEPRVVIEGVTPHVSGGFPSKRIVGEEVVVEADVFCDGHEVLGVELQWRRAGEAKFRCRPMTLLVNDRFRGSFPLEALGRHEFRVEAWIDRFGSLRSDLEKKIAAGAAAETDFQEAEALVAAARRRAKGEVRTALDTLLAGLTSAPPATRTGLLLAQETREVMARVDERAFRARTPRPLQIDAERLQARYASWYELFPRSQTPDAARSGSFDTVIERLPAIREMGFDVLYFPPIHPIGRVNRKGRNNTLTPGPDDPGSPYAIGSAEGGHDAVHPDLGGLEAFRRLVRAARDAGLEIALDFAVQCAPDHPWLKEHRDWFAWRADGTIRYAENPPKKYEDIVNVDFYAKDAVPDLWIALRDVVEFWISEGVSTFRVDNPHTKPLPFWRWMIEDIRSRRPDVIFLAEAFTRPKMMYRLAKVGFSQSYTYFTWRNAKWELEAYLAELADGEPKEFFRPHFFVNTPDINPFFLQNSGRGGFLIRAALAATLSGLFGVYSGYELLEAEPIPGKEEYLNSEKYEIKPRDWAGTPNIIPEISALNALRRAHPSLQTHLGVRFERAYNDMVLLYAKEADPDDKILIAVSLDPFAPQSAEVELPERWREAAGGDRLFMEDLLNGARFEWRGARQTLHLSPEQPYGIWRWVSETRP